MSYSAHVVDGEASESDSEIEEAKSPDTTSAYTRTYVISGEAPESDDENKVTSTVNDTDVPLYTSIIPPPLSPIKMVHNSILHQRLWDCNVSLRANVEGIANNAIAAGAEKLTTADKILLNVQESVRVTDANLTVARAWIKQLRAEMEKANCSKALPTVKYK